MKRMFTTTEKESVFDLQKNGIGFSDIARQLNTKPGTIFTIQKALRLGATKSSS